MVAQNARVDFLSFARTSHVHESAHFFEWYDEFAAARWLLANQSQGAATATEDRATFGECGDGRKQSQGRSLVGRGLDWGGRTTRHNVVG